jgi:DNA adenine methylase
VLLRKYPAQLEVYNDLDGEIVSFFRLLQSPDLCRQLVRLLKRTPWAREQFREAFGKPPDDPVIRAQRAVVRTYMCIHHSALFDMGKSGGFASADWSGCRIWRTYPNALVNIHRRLRGVIIENRDAFRLFDTHDAPDTVFFVDPPYLPSTRNRNTRYRCEMDVSQHIALLNRLNGLIGTAMVSGYPSDLYDDMLRGWKRVERSHYARANGVRRATEVLWIGPP